MAYKDVEGRRQYINQYQATKLKQWKIHLHKEHDADIIEYLDGMDNKQGYVKDLIREDMKKHRRV